MKILVLGSGLMGVTTAYYLAKQGMEVTVIDRQNEHGAETSFANAGQLSYSHAEPWATPGVLPKLPFWLLDPESPLVFRPRPDWHMWAWGLKFLHNCTSKRAAINCISILRLGLYSKQQMEKLIAETNIAFDYGNKGIVHIFGTQAEFDHARKQNDFQSKFGCHEQPLTREECMTLEPSLLHTNRTIVGGMHATADAYGDSFLFCNALAKYVSERFGVTFKNGVSIESLNAENGKITSVRTNQGDISADGYVMAMASYSPLYLRPLGIHIPVYPMKGYSITIPANEHCPERSIMDTPYKIAFSRLGDRLRVAGTAEFCGYDTSINESRIAPIVKAAKGLFPKARWDMEIQKWACLRASTPDGPPILGRTHIDNLFLNTGHGTLGWTQAAGASAIVADIIAGKNPEIMMQGLTYERY